MGEEAVVVHGIGLALLGRTEEEHEKLRVPGVSVDHLTEYLLNISETYCCYTSLFDYSWESTRNFFFYFTLCVFSLKKEQHVIQESKTNWSAVLLSHFLWVLSLLYTIIYVASCFWLFFFIFSMTQSRCHSWPEWTNVKYTDDLWCLLPLSKFVVIHLVVLEKKRHLTYILAIMCPCHALWAYHA